ncbi:MAG: hypothetical protein AAFR65_06915 [Pseudomonadota bacterium]
MPRPDASDSRADAALDALKQKSLPIAFTYLLSLVENLFELAYP